jgi:hypothetical protein
MTAAIFNTGLLGIRYCSRQHNLEGYVVVTSDDFGEITFGADGVYNEPIR